MKELVIFMLIDSFLIIDRNLVEDNYNRFINIKLLPDYMNITFVGTSITPNKKPINLDILADDVSAEDLKYFSSVVEKVTKTAPIYSEMGKGEFINFEVKDEKIIATMETPIIRIKYTRGLDYIRRRTIDHALALFYMVNQAVVDEAIAETLLPSWIPKNLEKANSLGREAYNKPSFLGFRAAPWDGLLILEEFAKRLVIAPEVIYPDSQIEVYNALKISPPRRN